MGRWSGFACVLLSSCVELSPEPPPTVIRARFDPEASVVPMPTDILRDEEVGRLDLPVDDADLSDAEREFYTWLSTLDGWSTTMPATVELTAPIARGTVTDDTLQVWLWRPVPVRVTDATVTLDETERKITIDAPRTASRALPGPARPRPRRASGRTRGRGVSASRDQSLRRSP